MTDDVTAGMSRTGRIEWKRMVSGQVYQDTHPDIDRQRERAENLFLEYNRTGPGQKQERQRILEDLLGRVEQDVVINPDFRCEVGCNIRIGSQTLINYGAVMLDNAPITIGRNVWIGPGAGLFCTNHALDYEERKAGACQARPIEICQGAWLGGHVVVLGGVRIGRGAVIGAGSVVTHDIPDQVVAVGNPCTVLRPITDEDRTGYLDRIRQQDQENSQDQ